MFFIKKANKLTKHGRCVPVLKWIANTWSIRGMSIIALQKDFFLKTAWRIDCIMKRWCILCKGSSLLWHDTCVSVRTAHIVKSLKHSLLCIWQMLAVGSALHGSILLNNQHKLRFRIARRCSVKKALVKLLQHSKENTCAMRSASFFIKKETLAQVFFCGFCKIFKNTFFNGTLLVAGSGN